MRRLLAVRPAEHSPPFEPDLSIRLLLADNPAEHLALINDCVLAGLKSEGLPGPSQLVEVACALLESPYRPLGIIFTRGVLSKILPLEAMMLVDDLLEARAALASLQETEKRDVSKAPGNVPADAQDLSETNHCCEQEDLGQQPLRLAQYPRKFQEDLRALPRAVARAALVLNSLGFHMLETQGIPCLR